MVDCKEHNLHVQQDNLRSHIGTCLEKYLDCHNLYTRYGIRDYRLQGFWRNNNCLFLIRIRYLGESKDFFSLLSHDLHQVWCLWEENLWKFKDFDRPKELFLEIKQL